MTGLRETRPKRRGTLAPVPLRPLRGEYAVAVAAALVGAVGIVSALTPEFANRSDFVRGVLPPGAPGAARILALAFGLALVWLSRLLARRRRRAWQLAVALVTGISLAHLAKGLDEPYPTPIHRALFTAAPAPKK